MVDYLIDLQRVPGVAFLIVEHCSQQARLDLEQLKSCLVNELVDFSRYQQFSQNIWYRFDILDLDDHQVLNLLVLLVPGLELLQQLILSHKVVLLLHRVQLMPLFLHLFLPVFLLL